MANVLHKVTKQYIQSANTANFLDGNWIINPDLSGVVGFQSKYWNVDGVTGSVTLKPQFERDAIDAAEVEARRDSVAAALDAIEGIDRAFALVVLDEINILRNQHSLPPRTIAQLKTALRSKLGS